MHYNSCEAGTCTYLWIVFIQMPDSMTNRKDIGVSCSVRALVGEEHQQGRRGRRLDAYFPCTLDITKKFQQDNSFLRRIANQEIHLFADSIGLDSGITISI
jgi:hypothetical protein